MELQEIIKHLKFICSQEGLNVSPESILDNAVKIYNTKQIDKSKKENIANYQKDKIINPSISTSPKNTIKPKQKAFLIKIKKYKEGMIKSEAYQIIKELANKNKEYKEY